MAKYNRRNSSGYGLGTPLPLLYNIPVKAQRAPTVADNGYDVGQVWIDQATNQAWIMTNPSVWMLSSPGASDVDTINGLSPVLGNILIDGGVNITDVNAGNTVTLNLDAAITLVTSVTTPILASAGAMAINPVGALVVTGGAAIDINAAAGSDITIQMGDAVGANIVEFEDSASAVVGSIDSNGIATFVGLEGIIGAVAPAIGTFTTVEATTYGGVGALDTIVTTTLGEDLILRLGDAAGANFLRVQDSTTADVWTVDSNGVFAAFAGLTVTGAFAQTAGTFNAGADAAANAVNIGTGAAAKVVTIGSTNGASSLALNAGTGNFALEGNVATTYAISNVGANVGQVDIAGGTGARTINLGLGGTGIKTINIGTAATADVISIGDGTGAGATTIDAGSGGFSIDSTGTSNITVTSAGLDLSIQGAGCAVNITSTEAENDAISIEASAANGGVEINAGTGGIRIGDEADCTGLTFGNIAPTATRNITIGSGTVVTAAVTDTINIATGGATTNANSIKTLNLNTGGVTLGEVLTHIATGAVTSGTHTVNIQSGNAAAGTVATNISTGTGIKNVNVGNADALTTIAINGPTAINTNVNAAFSACVGTSTGTVTLGNIATSTAMSLESSTTIDLDAAGIVSINSTAGTILIGDDDIDQNIELGTDGERVVTVGSINGAAGLVLQAGTADITVTGTVQDMTANFVRETGEAITFTQSPLTGSAADTGVAATGATGDVNLLSFQNGIIMEQFVLGAGQTIIKPVMTATGLLVSGDLVTTEGYEYNWGAARANSKNSFTIGTSAAFYLQWSFRAVDISGLEPCYCGFRRTQANQTVGNIALYTDFVAYGSNDGIAPGDACISTQLNTGGLINTDCNDAWADAATHTLRINVSDAGVVTFLFDGGAPTATQAFTFDNGDVVHPFFRHEFNAAVPAAIEWISMDCGFQA